MDARIARWVRSRVGHDTDHPHVWPRASVYGLDTPSPTFPNVLFPPPDPGGVTVGEPHTSADDRVETADRDPDPGKPSPAGVENL